MDERTEAETRLLLSLLKLWLKGYEVTHNYIDDNIEIVWCGDEMSLTFLYKNNDKMFVTIPVNQETNLRTIRIVFARIHDKKIKKLFKIVNSFLDVEELIT